ncbi:hypothetical protein [Streptomyces sp. NPDC047061]|uniref:hypothetical protein n=1 Tax=Streptomyces sp. NPDC047061 TaxID=3154605 RepID=UPI0033FD040A
MALSRSDPMRDPEHQPLERPDRESERRADVAQVLPGRAALGCLCVRGRAVNHFGTVPVETHERL